VVEIEQDILTVTKGIIVQQVNNRGVMGAGLAKQIADKWPVVKEIYQTYTLVEGLDLGTNIFIPVEWYVWVASIVGQDGYGRDRRYTNYDALRKGLMSVAHYQSFFSVPVYVPYGLGCGLGGGSWDVVKEILEEELPDAIICRLDR
jgi:O-acetyl-ADP-ribose deacetylase (regulator of RNase III)